jgi:hypothetical protein
VIPAVEFVGGGTLELRALLERLHEEIRAGPRELLISIADNVFRERAVDAFEEAAGIPLEQATLERKQRGRGSKNDAARLARRDTRDARGRRTFLNEKAQFTGVAKSSIPLVGSGGGQGLKAALTAPFEAGAQVPTALREIGLHIGSDDVRMSLRWGARGFLRYAGNHIYPGSSPRASPARLQNLDPKKHRAEYEEGIGQEIGAWLGDRLSAAGAPAEWIQQATGGNW